MEQFVDMMGIIEAHNEVVKAFKNSGIKIEFTFENAIKVNGIMQKLTNEGCKLQKVAEKAGIRTQVDMQSGFVWIICG